MGKITKLQDLPSDKEFIRLLKEAMTLSEEGIKLEAPKTDKKKDIEVPDYFAKN